MIAGSGAGEGDLPRILLTGRRRGEPAAADENDDRLDPARPLGGFMLDRGVDGKGGLAEKAIAAAEPLASGISDARVMTDPASEAVEHRRAIDGRT